MNLLSGEAQTRLAQLRAKIGDGSITQEEMIEATVILRNGRMSASVASDTARKKKVKAEIPDADDMLAALGQL